MKIRFTAGLFVLLALIALGIYLRPGILDRTPSTPNSTLMLESIKDISRLQIHEMIMQYVFPHDFIQSEDELQYIKEKRKQHRPLDSRELVQWEAYRLALSSKLYSKSWDTFVVITLRISAGVDIKELQIEVENVSTEKNSMLRIHMPPVTITNVAIEDIRQTTYPYPPIRMDAQQWQQVSSFVAREARFRIMESSFLETAEKDKQEMIRNLLTMAGFDLVQFY